MTYDADVVQSRKHGRSCLTRLIIVGSAAVVPLAFVLWSLWRSPELPSGLRGTLVFVSNRSGVDTLYERNLETGVERVLTHNVEPARSPAISPDGRRVAFEMGGRLAIVDRRSTEMRVVTLGVKWQDTSPAWRPDGQALVVASRRDAYDRCDLHLIEIGASGGPTDVARSPLTQTPGLDEMNPVFSPDGRFILFVRQDNIFRIAADGDGRPERLTGGFKKCRAPRFLPDGRLAFPWSLDKIHGIDSLDVEKRERSTICEGSIFYRDLAPSPDGAFLATTFTFDMAFNPLQVLRLRKDEELHLLYADGRRAGVIARSWRYAYHSPDWTKAL